MPIFVPTDWSIPVQNNYFTELIDNLDAKNFHIINLKDPNLANDAATRNWVLKNSCSLSQVDTKIKELSLLQNVDIDMRENGIKNLKCPSSPGDATTKQWVLENSCALPQVEAKIKELSMLKNVDIDMKNNKITNVAIPFDSGDVVNKEYLEYIAGAFLVKNSVIDMKTKRIVNLADPMVATDAVNRQFLENIIKQSASVAIKKKAFYGGTMTCNNTEKKMEFGIELSQADFTDRNLKIKQKAVYKIALWLRILSDNSANVITSLYKNDEEDPFVQHVFFYLNADVKEMDHYFGIIVELDENDLLRFTAKGTDAFSAVYYLKISHQGVLPE